MKNIFNNIKKWFYIKDGEEQNEINKQLVVIVVSIFVTIISVLGVTYSAFVWSDNSLKNQSLIVGNVELSIDSSSESLGSSLNYPVAQEDEYSLTPYTFTIKNNGTLSSSYKLKIVADDAYTNTMDTNYIYMSMTGGRTIERTPLSSFSEIPFDEGILTSGESKTYDLRLWIVENAPNSVIGKEWHGKIVLESIQTDIIADVEVSDLTLVSNENINSEAKNIEFTVKNSEETTKYLQLNLDEITISDELKNSYFKWRLLDGEIVINEGDFNGIANNKLLQRSIEIASNQEKTYNLLIWYSDADTSGINLTGKILSAKVIAEFSDNLSVIPLSESPTLINTITNNQIKNFKIYGNSIQDGIPTPDTPIEIQSVGEKSKNLINESNLSYINNTPSIYQSYENKELKIYTDNTSKWQGKFTKIPIRASELLGKTVTFSFEYMNSTESNTYMRVGYYTTGYTELKLQQLSKSSEKYTSASMTVTFPDTLPSDLGANDNFIFILYANADGTITNSANNWTKYKNIQLEYGDKVTEFEQGGYKIPIKVRGKNYCTNDWELGYIKQSDGKISATSGYIRTGYMEIPSGKIYSVTSFKPYTKSIPLYCYDENKAFLGIAYYLNKTSKELKTGTVYVRVCLNTTDLSQQLQIEEGTVSTSYEEYKEPITTNIYLNEPLRRISDTYRDYIDFANQKVVRNVEVVDNTGTLSLEESLRGLQFPTEESIQLPSPVTMNGLTNITINTKVKPLITGNY